MHNLLQAAEWSNPKFVGLFTGLSMGWLHPWQFRWEWAFRGAVTETDAQ